MRIRFLLSVWIGIKPCHVGIGTVQSSRWYRDFYMKNMKKLLQVNTPLIIDITITVLSTTSLMLSFRLYS